MNLSFAPLGAALIGAAAAAVLGALPTPMLESLVMASGIPAILSAAEPPLGMTARAAIAGGTGMVAAILSWFALFLLLGTRGFTIGREPEVDPEAVPTPVLRRADAHPDAPARAPLLATRDLGTPFLEVAARPRVEQAQREPEAEPEPEPLTLAVPIEFEPEPEVDSLLRDVEEAERVELPKAFAPLVEQPLPDDLDQPLAGFDPAAIPDTPAPLPEAVTPLHRTPRPAVFDEGERFETFVLTPPVRIAPPPRPRPRDGAITAPETEATIHALLERLERGVVRRGLASGVEQTRRAPEPKAERGLEEALVTLRNLARRA